MKIVSSYLDRPLRSVAEAQEQRRRRTGAAKTRGGEAGEATAGDRDPPGRGRHAPPNLARAFAGRALLVTEDDHG